MDLTAGNSIPRTALIADTSKIPYINELPAGFFIAVVISILIWWILKKTTIGFEIKTAGLNPHASKYAGMKVKYVLILTMFISGALAGIGGAVETAGVVHRFQPGFNIGLGFEGITIALLARANPLAVIPSAILIGAMKSGAGMMQFSADVPTEIIDVIQALILFFVAADVLIKKYIPFLSGGDKISINTGWGD
ncbi:MAG: ABC transporter permease [bacterium]|nr:ABC transporter permease [bacterium]